MKKVLIGLALGAVLGAIDGACSWFYPEVRAISGKVLFISLASAGKGLVAGLITGFVARRLHSIPLGLLVGLASGVLLSLIPALSRDPDTGKVYFWEIMIPGAMCGMIVGYVTQRYGVGAGPKMDAQPSAVR